MKKILIFMLCIMFIPSFAQVIAASENEEPDFEEYDLLTRLGVFEKNITDWDAEVTRGDMCKYVIKLINSDELAKNASEKRYFYDVTENDNNSGYINALCQLGFISQADEFFPENTAKVQELVKVLVCALGYGDMAEYMGGYPYGYVSEAANVGILKNTYGDLDGKLTMHNMFELFYNVLHSEIQYQNVNSNYERNGTDFLYQYFHIYYVRDVVNNNGLTTLKSSSNNLLVMIGDNSYSDPNKLALSYIGYKVKAYIIEKKDGDEEIFAIFEDKTNIVKAIKTDDVINWSNDRTSVEFCYKDKTAKLKISKYADYIYNGIAYPDFTYNDIANRHGYINYIDNNGDGFIEVINVSVYENYYVNKVNISDNIIVDMNGKLIKLDNKADYEIMDTNGSSMKLDEISYGYLISLFASKKGEYVKIIVSDNKVSGIIDEIRSDEQILIIDGVEYKVANNLLSDSDYSYLKCGAEVTFILDCSNQLAAVENKNGSFLYGFLKRVNYDEEGLGDDVSLKIFTQDGEFKNYAFANRIDFNSETVTKSVKERDIKKGSIYDSLLTPQVIKYSLNGLGEICKISLAVSALPEDDVSDSVLAFNDTIYNAQFRYGIFGSRYTYDSDNTVFLGIPNCDSDGNYDEEDFELLYWNTSFVENDYYKISVYDATSTRQARLIVCEPTVGSMDFLPNCFVVDKVGTIFLNDEIATQVSGYYQGAYVSYAIDKNVELIEPKKGDVIAIALNNRKEICQMSLILRYKDGLEYFDKPIKGDNSGSVYFTSYGIVVRVDNVNITTTSDNGTTIRPNSYNAANIYVIETGDKIKVRKGSYDEIMPSSGNELNGSNVLSVKRYDKLRDIVIIKR